jgi:hypothetical protein
VRQKPVSKAKEILEERYGNRLKLARSFRERIADWPEIIFPNGKALRELSDFLAQCETAMGTLTSIGRCRGVSKDRDETSESHANQVAGGR